MFEALQIVLRNPEGNELTPLMLERAGWITCDNHEDESISSNPNAANHWVKAGTKAKYALLVSFPETQSGSPFIMRTANYGFIANSDCIDSLLCVLLIQWPHIEWESPTDILKCLGV